MVVFPAPGFPSRRNTWPAERPPARIVSKPDTPVRAFAAGIAVFIHCFLQFHFELVAKDGMSNGWRGCLRIASTRYRSCEINALPMCEI
ncbi:hypothetical protein RHECNPAF_6420047 [Rhizobium etli CNPAF512]|nr:hypothetical protein RHECNPAF_6420047 [Rhizobium etli CNPAF512]